ncbi:BrnT family toxin [Xanthobacter autotrophicus]|uniref:BrnT family toxin n=1 Tax=Xanthobacter TaxID=279 RepID=UPI0024AA0ECB|nr:BrnT family toxin [Xanthobacter autotrophicus]MDI4665390.1 BrnT family toxin [Xanthobacter autotrophicus]
MKGKIAGFDWDEGNRDKCRKHGVSLAEIEALFHAAPAVYPDPAHSGTEERFLAIGPGKAGRMIFVAFTLRGKEGGTFIRPISARYMHAKEVRHYEEKD